MERGNSWESGKRKGMGTEGKRIRVPHLFNPILTTGCGAGGGMPICIPYSFWSPATSTPLVL